MPIDHLVLLGAGGHAKVVYDAIASAGIAARVSVRDDNQALAGGAFLDLRVSVPIGALGELPVHAHVGIGDNAARERITRGLLAAGKRLVAVVHPAASVSRHAVVLPGAFVAAGAIIAPGATVGECAIINHGAVVDHDCAVGPHAHVAPNATLGGGARVGEGTLIGAGAVLLPGISVGKWSVVGAGAVVSRSVGDEETVYGVPARRKRNA
jgi:sugar O-acyltransferase (sialic acid O-acetyltransferase NeuD family)